MKFKKLRTFNSLYEKKNSVINCSFNVKLGEEVNIELVR